MKRMIAISVMAMVSIAFSCTPFVMADDRISTITERWQARRDGIIIEDREKTTRALIPECTGATKVEVQAIAAELNRELFGGKTGKGKNAKVVKGAFQEVKDDIKNVASSVGDTLDTFNTTVGEIKFAIGGMVGNLRTVNSSVVAVGSKVDGLTNLLRGEVVNLGSSIWGSAVLVILAVIFMGGFGFWGIRREIQKLAPKPAAPVTAKAVPASASPASASGPTTAP